MRTFELPGREAPARCVLFISLVRLLPEFYWQSRFGPPHPNPVEEHVRRPWPSHEKGPSYNARDQTSYPNQIRERRDFKE